MTSLTFTRVRRLLTTLAVAGFLILGLSGAWLIRYYRPAVAIFGEGRRPTSVTIAIGVHRAAAVVLLLCLGVLLGVRLVLTIRRALLPALALVAGVGLVVTGRRIAWDLLGLWAVTVNLDATGMLFAAFEDIVRFVIVDGTELSQSTFRLLLALHALVLPVILVGALGVQRLRERPTAPAT